MKKLVALLCTAMLVLSFASTAMAAGSITELKPGPATVVNGTVPDGMTVVIEDADPTTYADPTVADVVSKYNSTTEDADKTIANVLQGLGLNPSTSVKTNKGQDIVPSEWEMVSPKFSDVVFEDLSDAQQKTFEMQGEVTVTFPMEIAKDADIENLLVMVIDQATGEVHYVEIEAYNAETGEVTLTLPCLGAIALIEKVAA